MFDLQVITNDYKPCNVGAVASVWDLLAAILSLIPVRLVELCYITVITEVGTLLIASCYLDHAPASTSLACTVYLKVSLSGR